MEMYEAIKNFNKQFAFEPEIINGERLGKFSKFVVAGMGGSHLAADLLKIWNPELDVIIHSGYGLSAGLSEKNLARTLPEPLVIASSYSGNTEETVDVFLESGKRNLPRAVIAVGGKLLELAKEEGVPYVVIPDTGIQPRMATGFSFKALLRLMNEGEALREVAELSWAFNPDLYEAAGREIAERLKGFAPIIYASARNEAIARNWKIKFNETAKVPAFCNVFPELNHNEMTGFDIAAETRGLSKNFYIIMLRDPGDHPKILRRMEVTAKLYKDRGLPVEVVELEGQNVFMKIFSSLARADWAAYYTAKGYGNDPNEVPMVEEFKGLIK